MSDCKCTTVSIYDGEHRCMLCYRLFVVAELSEEEYQDMKNRLYSERLKHMPMNPNPRYFIKAERILNTSNWSLDIESP